MDIQRRSERHVLNTVDNGNFTNTLLFVDLNGIIEFSSTVSIIACFLIVNLLIVNQQLSKIFNNFYSIPVFTIIMNLILLIHLHHTTFKYMRIMHVYQSHP